MKTPRWPPSVATPAGLASPPTSSGWRWLGSRAAVTRQFASPAVSQDAPRSSRVSSGVSSRSRERSAIPVRSAKARFASGLSEAAGQGLEPRLPDPESGVLPLDDPATGWRIVAAWIQGFGHSPSPRSSLHWPLRSAHSSSGLGHRPLTAAARVRIPYGPSLSSKPVQSLATETPRKSSRRDPGRPPSP